MLLYIGNVQPIGSNLILKGKEITVDKKMRAAFLQISFWTSAASNQSLAYDNCLQGKIRLLIECLASIVSSLGLLYL
jgi:hypothetical protein